MGVQVDRQAELAAQRRYEGRGGRGAQQARHVLDGQDVCARFYDLFGQAEVVIERVEALARVGQVRGVAEGDLGDRRSGGAYGVDGRAHLAHVVQRVEDAEDVDAGGGGLLDEGVGHLGRVGRVADGVAAAQQHLEADVGDGLAQGGQPVPGVLGEEAQRDVVGGAAPALQGEELGHGVGDDRGDREEVLGADAGGEE